MAIRILFALLVLVVTTTAQAGQRVCPWDEITEVRASLTRVFVNGESHRIRGEHNRALFVADLDRCGLDRAAIRFRRWRDMQVSVNVAGGGSVAAVLLSPAAAVVGGLATGALAIAGETEKSGFIREMRRFDGVEVAERSFRKIQEQPKVPVSRSTYRRMNRGMQPDQQRKLGNGLLVTGASVLVVSAVAGIYGHQYAHPDCGRAPIDCPTESSMYAPAIGLGVLGAASAVGGLGLHIAAQKSEEGMKINLGGRF